MKNLILILCMFLCTQASADDAAYLAIGAPAPFAGYLITPKAANDIRLMDIDLSSTKKLYDLSLQENTVVSQRLANAKLEEASLSQQLVSERTKNSFEKFGYFFLGAALTGFISYGVVKTIK